jgi:hypothetical protein
MYVQMCYILLGSWQAGRYPLVRRFDPGFMFLLITYTDNPSHMALTASFHATPQVLW